MSTVRSPVLLQNSGASMPAARTGGLSGRALLHLVHRMPGVVGQAGKGGWLQCTTRDFADAPTEVVLTAGVRTLV